MQINNDIMIKFKPFQQHNITVAQWISTVKASLDRRFTMRRAILERSCGGVNQTLQKNVVAGNFKPSLQYSTLNCSFKIFTSQLL